MATRTRTKRANRAKQARKPDAGNRAPAAARKPGKPALAEAFYVAVDRQLKSGHATFEAAEKAALAIKKQHPKLHVTVYDVAEERHRLIERPPLPGASNKARPAARVIH